MLNLENIQPLDYLRAGALVVAFGSTAFADKKGSSKIWIQADAIVSAFIGAFLFFHPSSLLKHTATVEHVDVAHDLLARILGVVMMTSLLIWYLSHHDGHFQMSWLLSRVMCCSLLLTTMWHAHYKYSKDKTRMNDQHISFTILGGCLLLLGNLIHLIGCQDYGRLSMPKPASDRVGVHFAVHIVVSFASSMYALAFPADVLAGVIGLKNFHPDGLHVYLLIGIHVRVLSFVFHGLISLFSSRPDNRRASLLCYVSSVGAIMAWMLLYQWKYSVYKVDQFCIMSTVIAVMVTNALAGAFGKA